VIFWSALKLLVVEMVALGGSPVFFLFFTRDLLAKIAQPWHRPRPSMRFVPIASGTSTAEKQRARR
jgi:hypothetical protein